MKYLMPLVLTKAATENSPSLLQELSACRQIRVRDLIIDFFPVRKISLFYLDFLLHDKML